MISTGREYDRCVIGVMIITVFCLAVYVMRANHNLSKLTRLQGRTVEERINHLANEVDTTRANMAEWIVSTPSSTETVDDYGLSQVYDADTGYETHGGNVADSSARVSPFGFDTISDNTSEPSPISSGFLGFYR